MQLTKRAIPFHSLIATLLVLIRLPLVLHFKSYLLFCFFDHCKKTSSKLGVDIIWSSLKLYKHLRVQNQHFVSLKSWKLESQCSPWASVEIREAVATLLNIGYWALGVASNESWVSGEQGSVNIWWLESGKLSGDFSPLCVFIICVLIRLGESSGVHWRRLWWPQSVDAVVTGLPRVMSQHWLDGEILLDRLQLKTDKQN